MKMIQLFVLSLVFYAGPTFADDIHSTGPDNVDEVKRQPTSDSSGAASTEGSGYGPEYGVPDYIDAPQTVEHEPRGAVESLSPIKR